MIIGIIKGVLFFSIFSLNQNFIRTKVKARTRSHELLNGQESSDAPLANRVGDWGRKYGSYLSESPVSFSVYASMIIVLMRGCCFSEFSLSIKILLEKRGRQRQDHMNF